MKVSKKKLIIFILVSIIIPAVVFCIQYFHLEHNNETLTFPGDEIKQEQWWIDSYNEYYYVSSIALSFLICSCIFIAMQVDINAFKGTDKILLAMCIWLCGVNSMVLTSTISFFLSFLSILSAPISFLFVTGGCIYLMIKAEKPKKVMASILWIIMALTIIYSIWNEFTLFGLFGD